MKFKGRLGLFFNWPIIITVVLVILNLGVYAYDGKSGAFVSIFIILYAAATGVVYSFTTPHIAHEVLDFAAEYSTVQKKLLNELEVPYVLLDSAGKVMWLNERFGEITGIDKKDANLPLVRSWLHLAGVKKIFCVCPFSGEGVEELLAYVREDKK